MTRRFLRPDGTLATSYPHRDPYELPYRVVTHGPGHHVGVCDETAERIKLTTEELMIEEIDRPAFHRAIARGLGLDCEDASVEHLPSTRRIGSYAPVAGYRFPAYLTIPFRMSELQRTVDHLAAAHDNPFLFLLPTYRLLRPPGEDMLPRGCSTRPAVAAFACIQARRIALCWTTAGTSSATAPWTRSKSKKATALATVGRRRRNVQSAIR
ncbi:MAG TPA: hypothetical protein VMY42_14845 [Thermoguttaceae bacterium]|nr:hypothetical protein [Thermoguttaceae bacterium]